MTGETDREWSPAEREALLALRVDAVPPAGLEERVMASLSGTPRGRRRRSLAAWGTAAAAAAVAFLAGLALGGGGGAAEGPRFVLLLEETAATAATGVPVERLVAEYSAWAESLAESGRLVSGEKLAPGGRTLEPSGDGVAVSPAAPLGSSRELGGYFVIAADGWEEALSVARTCPHLKYGGTIVVRRIEAT